MKGRDELGMSDGKLVQRKFVRIDTSRVDPKIVKLWKKRAEFLNAVRGVVESQLAGSIGGEYSIAVYALLAGAPIIYDEMELNEIVRRSLSAVNSWRAQALGRSGEAGHDHPFSKASLRIVRNR